MLNEGIPPVIKTLKKLPKEAERLRRLIGYYTNYQKRMQYHLFREKGGQHWVGSYGVSLERCISKKIEAFWATVDYERILRDGTAHDCL